jgi:hypothetical protein
MPLGDWGEARRALSYIRVHNWLRSATATHTDYVRPSWTTIATCGFFLVIVVRLLLGAAQPSSRAARGTVTDADGNLVSGAIVQIENIRTLEIRSFITQKEGQFYFRDLSPDVDYELKAEAEGRRSGVKKLSRFDSRQEAVIDLKLGKNR